MSKVLANCTGFDWDEGNSDKNLISHQVANSECEEVFFNRPLIVADDKKHSIAENAITFWGAPTAADICLLPAPSGII